VICTAVAIEKNRGVTGIGRLIPFGELEMIVQKISNESNAETIEVLKVLGKWKIVNRLVGKYNARKKENVEELFYESAVLAGGMFKLRADSKAVLKVTYLDRSIRICRALKSNELYVFRKK